MITVVIARNLIKLIVICLIPALSGIDLLDSALFNGVLFMIAILTAYTVVG